MREPLPQREKGNLLLLWSKGLLPVLFLWYVALGGGLVQGGRVAIDTYWQALPSENYSQALLLGMASTFLFLGGRFLTLLVGAFALRLSGGDLQSPRPLDEAYSQAKPKARLWGTLLGGLLALSPWEGAGRIPLLLGASLFFFLLGFLAGLTVRLAYQLASQLESEE